MGTFDEYTLVEDEFRHLIRELQALSEELGQAIRELHDTLADALDEQKAVAP